MGKNIRENLDYFMEKTNCSYAICPYYLIAREHKEKLDKVGEIISVNKKKLQSGGFLINRSTARAGHTAFMFLTNHLLEIFQKPLNSTPKVMNDEYADLIMQSLLDYYEFVTDERIVRDKPLKQTGDMKKDMIKYINEVLAVNIVLDQFIGSNSKKALNDIETINDIVTFGTVFHEAFNERLTQVKYFYFLTDMGIKNWCCSQGILPLVWCEIKFCIENHIKIKKCPYCGIIYICPPNNPNKHHCGNQKCLYQYIIETKGPDFEAKRKANKKAGRLPGCPKKSE